MTKERKIAITMWKYIRDNYDKYFEYMSACVEEGYEGEDALCYLKNKFLEDKDVNWAMHCWFCEYIGLRSRTFNTYRCKLCPLKSCTTGPYHMITQGATQEQYIEACNQIIEALGGDI